MARFIATEYWANGEWCPLLLNTEAISDVLPIQAGDQKGRVVATFLGEVGNHFYTLNMDMSLAQVAFGAIQK